MKLLLIAGTNENLTKLATKAKTADSEILILQDYIFHENEISALLEKLQACLEVLMVSDSLCGVVNSSAVRLFEILSKNSLNLNLSLKAILCSDDDNIIFERYLRNVCNSLNINFGGIITIKPSKCSDLEELDISSKLDKLNKDSVLNKAKIQPLENLVTIYTDGACSGNPGAGGWGVVLIHGEKIKELSGYEKETTNNKMELTAVIKGLQELKKPCNVELYSDSAYVVNAITQNWLTSWKSNGWKNSDKKPVKNQELWKELDGLLSVHNVNFNKVKGHSDNKLNNRCDELATGEISMHQIDE